MRPTARKLRKWGVFIPAVSLLCLASFSSDGGGLAWCSVGVRPTRADHGTAILLARGTPDTLFVGTESLPAFLQDRQPQTFSPRPVWSQRFIVDDLVGRGAPLLDELGAGFEALLIPWGADDVNCLPGPWTERAQWVEGDYLGVHLAWLRPRTQWIDGTPTFDVPYAFSQPYGFEGDTVPSGFAGPWGAHTAAELFEINRMMTQAPDSLAAVAAFNEWGRRNPGEIRKNPTSTWAGWATR